MKGEKIMIGLFILLISLIPVLLYADTGPKPSTTIKLENPPEGTYYIDLLMSKDPNFDSQLEVSKQRLSIQNEFLEVLLSYRDENGWSARFDASPIDTGVHANNRDSVYTFDYMAVPYEFRIIIVTSDKKVHVSPIIYKRTYDETMTYDFATGKVTQKIIFSAYWSQFLSTCIPTLIVEGIVLLLFRFSLKRNLIVFLLTNIGTQILMTLTITPQMPHGVLLVSYFYFIGLEMIIMLIECLIYLFTLVGREKKYRVAYGMAANLASVTIGFLGLIFKFL